jgi:hypothetical protein
MTCLFDVIGFDVRKYPHIPRVFPKRIARELACFWPLKMLLPRILGRNPDRVGVEMIVVTFCKPENSLIATRQPLGAMQAMLEMPDHPIA